MRLGEKIVVKAFFSSLANEKKKRIVGRIYKAVYERLYRRKRRLDIGKRDGECMTMTDILGLCRGMHSHLDMNGVPFSILQ